jgi:hypothetical protein
MAFIKDNPAPATVVLISGDRDFAYLLSTIRWRKYNVVLISNSFMTHESLSTQASFLYDWQSDILKTRPPSKLPSLRSRPGASFSATFPTTTQELDSLLGPGVHSVGLRNERTTPTIQPLALAPPLGGIATTSTTRPTHAALPPDAPLMESEATPIRPKAEIPAKATLAGIPMILTSDDRIIADLTSESAMVHLVIIHRIVADLGFQQDRSSPRTIDPIDEDGVYSPAFVSTCAKVREVFSRKEGFKIDTSITKTRPGPLDLSAGATKNVVAVPPSALATAMIIEDLCHIWYPEGVTGPRPELNVNSRNGKFM